MTTLCCVAKFIRTLSTVISTIDLKLPLYTAGVHRVSDISIIHLFVVICHYATTSPHLNPQVHSAHPPRLVPASGYRVTSHPLSIVPGFANFSCLYCTLIRGLCANNWPVQSDCCKI